MSYQFQGQRVNEEVVLVSHQHPFVLIRRVLFSILLLLIPFAVWLFSNNNRLFGTLLVICFLVSLGNLWLAWLRWSQTLFLLTNERVIFLQHLSLFRRHLIECRLESVQQVSHDVNGILQTVAGYGNLSIFAMGSQQPIVLPDLPDPYAIQQEILGEPATEE